MNIFINHLKSQGYSGSNDPAGNIRRERQAEKVVKIVSELDLKKDFVIVAGDLNCDPVNPSIDPLLKNPDLYNLNLSLPEKERGTYRTGKKQLDYLIVSKPLEQRFNKLHIERRGIFPVKDRYPTVTNKTTEASDHAAVVAEFNF